METILLTIGISGIIAAALAAVVAKMIIDKKRGKHACSCGASCGACPVGCSCDAAKK